MNRRGFLKGLGGAAAAVGAVGAVAVNAEPARPVKNPDEFQHNGYLATVLDLLRDIDAARDRMSISNPNKALLHRCGAAVIELARKAHAMDVQHLATPEQVAAIVEGVPV